MKLFNFDLKFNYLWCLDVNELSVFIFNCLDFLLMLEFKLFREMFCCDILSLVLDFIDFFGLVDW